MRIELNFAGETPLKLPKDHNHFLEGFIYSHLEPVLARFLHEVGFSYQKRRFPLFTFSRILGRPKLLADGFEFTPHFRFIISSPKREILQSLAENPLKKEKVELNGQTLFIESINVPSDP